MSFSFQVNGHAGTGMEGNSQEEIDAVHAVVEAALQAMRDNNLDGGIYSFSPPQWAPETTTT